MPLKCWLPSFCLLVLLAPVAAAQEVKAPAPNSPEARFFESKIRPLLAENCFRCHGGGKRIRGDLNLTTLGGMLTGGGLGPALVPGEADRSLIIKAIRYTDKDLKMPPTKKLSAEQVDLLTQWVKMGAPWPGAEAVKVAEKKGFRIRPEDREHWAFQPLQRPPIPEVKNKAWVSNPIDAFILARLEKKGLQPNPAASKRELVRRVYFDLTGLPPSPQEVEAFVNDTSPKAYENLVERLLHSPRYGERWGRYWLDLVRYAETNSYERDNPKPHIWRYRDYVIRSFNEDKPYDQFLREQLAGDELPNPTADSIIATGYYRLGIWDDEPSDPLLARYDALDDIVATTSHVFLGMTVDCARCHDHKIDPIAQRDYYSLLAFFHNINHYRNGGPTDERPLLFGEARQQHEQKVRALEQQRNRVQEQITVIERDFRGAYEKQFGVNAVGSDLDDLHYRFYRSAWNSLPDFSTIKAEESGKLPRNLFDLSPRTRDQAIGFVFEGTLIVPETGRYTFFLDSDDGSRLLIDGKKVLEYDGIHGVGSEKNAAVELQKGRLPIKLEYFQNQFGYGLHVAWSGPGFERRLLSATEKVKTADLNRAMAEQGRRVLGQARFQQYQQLKQQLKQLKQQQVPAEMALCVTEAGTRAPETFVLLRGNPTAKGDKVEPAFLTVLNVPAPSIPTPEAGVKSSGRRTVLADWLTAKDNPLPARVMVNRLWQYHFGRGIVRTPSDFGLQGSPPTHPKLLDWLATEFIARGWKMKDMHRLIMTSQAYQMSAKANPKALEVDQDNDLFWRFDMRRLTAEEIRDAILAVCGNLNLKMYGPGIYPEIPPAVLAGQSVPGRGWGKSSPEEQARRSIYIHVKRSLLYPLLESFDLAEPDRSTPVRFSTTQPTQALGMLNGDFLNKQAGIFAERLRREAGDDTRAQVQLALALATSRPPSDDDIRRGVDLIQALQSEDGASREVALRYFCLVVLNLNEFMYVD